METASHAGNRKGNLVETACHRLGSAGIQTGNALETSGFLTPAMLETLIFIL